MVNHLISYIKNNETQEGRKIGCEYIQERGQRKKDRQGMDVHEEETGLWQVTRGR